MAASAAELVERMHAAQRPVARGLEALTVRERDILDLLAGPLSRAEIAAAPYVSPDTVKTHLRGIYRKLSTSTRSETVARARELGLL